MKSTMVMMMSTAILFGSVTDFAACADSGSCSGSTCEDTDETSLLVRNIHAAKALDKESTTADGKKDKACSDPGCDLPNVPSPEGICYAFGDPHVYTFDGAGVVFKSKVMNIWLVHSVSVQIQALSAKNGQLEGVAFGGEWMNGHKLILSPKGVTFDGKLILLNNNDEYHVSGLVELHRHARMTLNDQQIQELDGESNWWSRSRSFWYKSAKKGPAKYHFKLPLNVEVWISGPWDRRQVMIKMPRQGNQGGYCGNFNGDSKDDWKPGTNTHWLGHALAEGTMLDAIEESEDLFKQAKISAIISMLQSVTHDQVECSEELMKKAKKACSHIPERLIHDSCVEDICLTKNLTLADGAMEMEMMNVLYATGIPEFQGVGRCLDKAGANYSTIEATSISDTKECSKMLHEISHHSGLVGKGVRGAQFKDGACQILVENITADLLEELPGQWQGQETYSGSGIVSDSDNVEGWSCWKII